MVEVAAVLVITKRNVPQDVVGQRKTETHLESHFECGVYLLALTTYQLITFPEVRIQ